MLSFLQVSDRIEQLQLYSIYCQDSIVFFKFKIFDIGEDSNRNRKFCNKTCCDLFGLLQDQFLKDYLLQLQLLKQHSLCCLCKVRQVYIQRVKNNFCTSILYLNSVPQFCTLVCTLILYLNFALWFCSLVHFLCYQFTFCVRLQFLCHALVSVQGYNFLFLNF